MNDVTFHLLKIVVSVCIALIVFYLIPILKNKLNEDKYTKLLEMIDIAVRAAEQTVKGSGAGAIKKENVMIFINNWMHKNGFSMSQDQLSQLIEAAVFTMNQGV